MRFSFLLTCRRNVFEYFDQEQENIFIFVLLTMSKLFKLLFSFSFSVNATKCFSTMLRFRCSKDAGVIEPVKEDVKEGDAPGGGWLDKFKRILSGGPPTKPYEDYVPLVENNLLYSANVSFDRSHVQRIISFLLSIPVQISIRFPYDLRGKYHFMYHNCFNYHAHGYRYLPHLFICLFTSYTHRCATMGNL